MDEESMSDKEFLIVPWGDEDGETEVVTIDLPSREITVQAEVPIDLLENMKDLASSLDLPPEEVLADRLEMNLAKVKILSASHARDIESVNTHLKQAKSLVSGVQHLGTEDIEQRIETVWTNELNSEDDEFIF